MQFYVLVNPEVGENDSVTDYESTGKVNVGDAERCKRCSSPISMLPWLPPFRASLRLWGKNFGDVAFGSSELMFSKRFVDAWIESELKGLEILGKATITRIIPKRMTAKAPAYYIARVALTRAFIDTEASGAVYNRPWTCPECHSGGTIIKFSRLTLQPSTVGNEDIFFCRDSGSILIVSNRFWEFCQTHAFLNFKLIPAEEYSRDWSNLYKGID